MEQRNNIPLELRMIKVIDSHSGQCLFTESWKWEPQANEEGVTSLVQSFTQFAREIDAGDVVNIRFGAMDSSTIRPYTNSELGKSENTRQLHSYTSSMSSDTIGSLSPQPIEMLSQQKDTLQAVLFHDSTTESRKMILQEFLIKLLEQFQSVFKEELETLQVSRVSPSKNATVSSIIPNVQGSTAGPKTKHVVAIPFQRFQATMTNVLLPSLAAKLPPQ